MGLRVRVISIFLCIQLIICLFVYIFFDIEFDTAAVLSIITIILTIFNILSIDNHCFTYTSALMVYTLCTQFGLILPYYFFGRDVLDQYIDYTLSFLQYNELGRAVLLGNIGVLAFEISKCFSKRQYPKNYFADFCDENYNENKKVYVVGTLCLLIVFLYFVYHILFGSMHVFSTYDMFMNSSAYRNTFYSYVLILFYVGSIYLAAAGGIKDHKAGWFVWMLLVLVFALNGNKGEFLYALLAVFGLKGLQGKKLSLKSMMIAALLVFFVIPSITSLRFIGIVDSLDKMELNFFDAFSEMGMQIRTSVYVLNDLNNHEYSFLYGKSYYQPIINILTPFFSHETATQSLRETYHGFGFNQVIESYLNFGVWGVLSYFCIIGFLLAKWENGIKDSIELAYIGTITCILINATRNYFSFVPGQFIIVTLIYIIIRNTRLPLSGGRYRKKRL